MEGLIPEGGSGSFCVWRGGVGVFLGGRSWMCVRRGVVSEGRADVSERGANVSERRADDRLKCVCETLNLRLP